MMGRKLKNSIALLLVLSAAAAIAACGDDGDGDTAMTAGEAPPAKTTEEGSDAPAQAPPVEKIVVRDGAPVGGVAELEFDAGETIRFEVSSNQADEVHVHGYDVEEEVPAGGTAQLAFEADIEGIFEVEMHHGEEQIAELRVNP
jgi:hypothetical protein